MFGVGGTELFIILVIALIVLGPNKLPDLARMLGKAMGELQRATSDLKREIDVAGEHKNEPAAQKPDEKSSGNENIPTGNSSEEKVQNGDDKRGAD